MVGALIAWIREDDEAYRLMTRDIPARTLALMSLRLAEMLVREVGEHIGIEPDEYLQHLALALQAER